ncbi:glycosyl hydrolase 108 family protein [Mesorhizobium sp. NBIMC_P2-C3]|nr:glycosyl hydrolase 108 family protein [Mesorhizobium sp. NBIMC_P2-C3]
MPASAGMAAARGGAHAPGRFQPPEPPAMRQNFEASLKLTLKHEGEWADHPRDPGGATMKGITLATYRRFVPNATKTALRNIAPAMVARIYRLDYWDKVGADRLATGVDLATFDAGVMSGPGRAKKWLAASLGGADHQTVKMLCGKRLGFVRSLAIWRSFGGGWGKRIAAIEARGVAWALAASLPGHEVKAALADEHRAAQAKARTRAAGSGGTGAATAGGGGDLMLNPGHAEQLAGWSIAALLAAGMLVALVFAVRAVLHRQRAAAYRAEIEAMGDA